MLLSRSFIPLLREDPSGAESISHKLSLKSGLVSSLSSGIFTYLPLGLRVLSNIQAVIREHMNAAGAQELLMPALQPMTLWETTGRDKTLADVMISFTDKKNRRLCLGPTHEEVVTDLARRYISSYKQVPSILYQIQTKFRDEIRPRFGLVRSCEFIMKDAYSFDRDEQGLERSYQSMLEAYKDIFDEIGLRYVISEADVGAMGGSASHEFLVPAESGEDSVHVCGKCKTHGSKKICASCGAETEPTRAMEIGHIFKLMTKYSSVQEALFVDEDGKRKPLIMGCYGIGVSRLIAAVIEQHYDPKGIIWPYRVAPYKVNVVNLSVFNNQAQEAAAKIYHSLTTEGVEALYDDRDLSAGEKFNDAYLLGIPYIVIVGKGLKEGVVEIEERATGVKTKIAKDDIEAMLKKVSE